MRPNIVSGQAVGTVISVTNSTELAQLDIQGIALGTKVYNIATQGYFALVRSTAALVPDQVVAVNGTDGMRWVLSQEGSGPGLNPTVQYISDLGDDGNDGKTVQTAKKTGYAAAAVICTASDLAGGTIYVSGSASWGGPVPGQGLMFTSRSGIPELGIGYQYGPPLNIIGIGASNSGGLPTPFQGNGVAILRAGSNMPADYDLKPGVLLSSTFLKINLYNIQLAPATGFEGPYNGAPFASYRMGWDYRRTLAGAYTSQVISQAQRSGTAGAGTTVFNTNLVGPVQVTSATRSLINGVWTTVLTIPLQGSYSPPWESGTPVYFTDTSGHFTSGVYTVGADLQTTIDSTAQWGFSIVDGQTTAVGPVANPGSVASAYAYPGCRISVQLPNNPHFLSTSYPVISSAVTGPTTGTVTVSDIYGAATSKPWGNIPVTTSAEAVTGGVMMVEERSWDASTGWTLENCATRACQDPSQLARMRPGVDIGATNAFTPQVDTCYLQGYYDPTVPYDGYRMDSLVAQGGPSAATGYAVKGGNGQQASFRANTAITLTSINSVSVDDFLYDSDGTGHMPGLYTILGNSATSVFLNDLVPADYSPGYGPALNLIIGISPLKLTGNSCSGYTGPSAAPSSNVGAIAGSAASWVRGPRAGLKGNSVQYVARHASSWRGGPPYYARVPNYARNPEAWSPLGTISQTGPFGDTDATQYDNTAGGSVLFHSGRDAAYGPGWYVVIAGWFCGVNGGIAHSGNVSVGLSTVGTGTFVAGVGEGNGGTSWTGLLDDPDDGWQFGAWYAQVATNFDNFYQASVSTPIGAGSGSSLMLFDQMTIQWFDPAVYTDLDISEYIGTIKACPPYLPAGMVGTIRGQKLIAHGGIGTAKHYVSGVASGQITVGAANNKYVELFDESGNSLGVFGPGSAFTVNP